MKKRKTCQGKPNLEGGVYHSGVKPLDQMPKIPKELQAKPKQTLIIGRG